MANWCAVLRRAREQAGFTQRELAARSGVSEAVLSRYERGRTRPSRRAILRLARAGEFDRQTTNALLQSAGHAPVDPLSELVNIPLADLFHEAGTYRWPCLVLNETADVVAWNEPANRVAELDFARDLPMRYQRSLFHIAALDHFAQGRVRNWDEVMRVMARMYKNNGWDIAQIDREPAYYQQLVAHLAREHAAGFSALAQLWLATPPPDEEGRWTFRAEWCLDDGTELNFNCIIGPWDTLSSANACDWFPADAKTWRWLDAAAPARPASRAPYEAAAKPEEEGVTGGSANNPGQAVGRLLRTAREYLGQSRPQVAGAAGIAVDTLLSIECGRRRPAADTLMRLADALQLDGVTLNTVRSALGFDPVPSDLARFIAGVPQRRPYWRYEFGANAVRARSRLPHTIAGHPWPCLIVDGTCAIVADNAAVRRVVGRPLADEAIPRSDRHLLAVLFGRQFCDHVLNWAGMVRALIPSDLQAGAERPIGMSPSLPTHSVLARLLNRDPRLRAVLAEISPPKDLAVPQSRLVFPLTWRHTDGTTLSFDCVFSSWSPHHQLWALDWHPADASTWNWFAARTGPLAPPPTVAPDQPTATRPVAAQQAAFT